ncbi:MAG: avidin/streptavidin family protein [Candidatus Obscuribacterales bacterium]|nr:avidin/streptavidin family protein [Candidatus Obscuribacterales bacterium]
MTSQQLTENMRSNQGFAGAWHNQNNSELVLMVGADGTVNGSFRLDRNHAPERAFPLVGYACDSAIAFCVNFAEKASVTSWVGHLVRHEDSFSLETLWHMAVHVSEHSKETPWSSVVSGADVFERGPRTGSMLWQKAGPENDDF